MNQEEFVRRNDGYTGFIELRNVLNDCINNPRDYRKSFVDMFADVGALAMAGNSIAQDVMSYYYKTGVRNTFPENYDLYMQWEILAGANGNEFAIEKLQFFLSYAFEQIVDNEQLPKILTVNNINENNYIYVLGNLLCEGIVDELQITAKKLVENQSKQPVKYSPDKLRVYRKALNNALPKVLDYLLS